MHTAYQLSIYKHGKLLGNFQSDTPQALQDMQTVWQLLRHHPALHFELLQVIEESRLLMQKDGALQLLGHQYRYVPCALTQLIEEASCSI
ncbi:hypothetical protein BFG52_16290 [Acinetobacter larvae]|uniref:Uncharacterized protein n=2 Tax=Acinetobacter larvae TaxID=1789224 RepID=A0A1B2M3Y2_9GAMM|nr:hypothetical protein BFG52_16290 [Acinetobacter larvae]